jgi:hypothetical protein
MRGKGWERTISTIAIELLVVPHFVDLVEEACVALIFLLMGPCLSRFLRALAQHGHVDTLICFARPLIGLPEVSEEVHEENQSF